MTSVKFYRSACTRARVCVNVTVPGTEVVASREPPLHHAHEDVYVAIRDVFDATPCLADWRTTSGGVAARSSITRCHRTGTLPSSTPRRDTGKIATADGRLVYFHKNSLVDARFDQLRIGDEVRFVEEMGERGPQASTVRRVGKHHILG